MDERLLQRTLDLLREKVELLTGERAGGERRAALVSELDKTNNRVSDNSVTANRRLTSLETKAGENSAAISTEQTVRADAVSALANQITTLTATVNANTASIREEYFARINSENVFANSLTTISVSYGNSIASISSSLSATINKVDNTLGVQWAIKGNINGVTGGLTFTGVGRADGTGATYDLEIDANVTINGNLLVTGTISNPKLADNSVSNNAYAEGGSGTSVTVYCRAGARMVILCTHGGGGTYSFNANGSLVSYVNGSAVGGQTILSAIVAATIIGSTNQFFPAFSVMPTTLLTLWVAPAAGNYTFMVGSDLGGTLKILVTELSK